MGETTLDQIGEQYIFAVIAKTEAQSALGFLNPETDPNSDGFHPGDPFGRVVGILWREGRGAALANLVSNYMAEIRDFAPNRPVDGKRVTFGTFLRGLPLAINRSALGLSASDVEELIEFLDTEVPQLYSHEPDSIDKP